MPAPSRTERREGPRGPRADEPPREGQSPPADEPAAAGKGARARRGRGIIVHAPAEERGGEGRGGIGSVRQPAWRAAGARSEEHTSELQSRGQLVCRLLLEKKKR